MIRAHGRHAECCLNWNTCIYKTGVENFKWNTRKKWTSSLKLVVILSAVSLHWNCARIFKYNDIQYTILTPDKILNSLVHRTLLYVNIYGSYKLPKNSPVFWPTLYIYIYPLQHCLPWICSTQINANHSSNILLFRSTVFFFCSKTCNQQRHQKTKKQLLCMIHSSLLHQIITANLYQTVNKFVNFS